MDLAAHNQIAYSQNEKSRGFLLGHRLYPKFEEGTFERVADFKPASSRRAGPSWLFCKAHTARPRDQAYPGRANPGDTTREQPGGCQMRPVPRGRLRNQARPKWRGPASGGVSPRGGARGRFLPGG